MNRIAIAQELLKVAKELTAAEQTKTAAMGKSEIVILAAIMKNTGVAKNERFVTALVGWLSDRNPSFNEDKFRAALE